MTIVRCGTWLYAGSVAMPVDIVALTYDFWFELGRAEDQLEPGEAPQPLSDEGLLYYVRFAHAGDPSAPTWPDSAGYSTVEGAMRAAEKRVPGDITWE